MGPCGPSQVLLDQIDINDDDSEFKIFLNMFPNEIIEHCVQQTNNYAKQYLDGHPNLPPKSRARKWTETNLVEMRAFLGLLLFMGYMKCPSYHSYWNTDPISILPGIRDIMSRDRWLLLWQFFHLADNTMALPTDHPEYDKLFKIRPFLDMIVEKWKSLYTPSQNISVDESMIAFKGRTNMMQYMPAKPHKWGIKGSYQR